MNVNYDTQVQPNHAQFNHALPFGMDSEMGEKVNTPNKVDKASQGAFDRSMNKEGADNTHQMKNAPMSETQQLVQQIMERLAPLIGQIIEEILGGVQEGQETEGAGAANQASENSSDKSEVGQQASSPEEQLMQQIMERLMPLLEQIIQEMTGNQLSGNEETPPAADSSAIMPSQVQGSGSSEASSSMGEGQAMNPQDQLMQQIMDVLVPLIAQIVESVFASINGQSNAGSMNGNPQAHSGFSSNY